jgi:hypothetical protein
LKNIEAWAQNDEVSQLGQQRSWVSFEVITVSEECLTFRVKKGYIIPY